VTQADADIRDYLQALQVLIRDPIDRAAVLKAAEFLDRGSPCDKHIEFLLYRYLYNYPDDRAVLARFIAAERSWFNRQLAESEIRDTNYVRKPYLVTALVSTWNAEDFVEECLDDLEAQTVAERLAASPQNERAVVERFQERYSNVRYVRTPERINIYEAWNLAIHLASGEYLTTFSTNDRLKPSAYEILGAALEKNPQRALAYGDSYATDIPHQTFDRFTYSKKLQGGWKYSEYSFADLMMFTIVGPHPMWRRLVHEEIGYFNGRYLALGDQDLWMRMARRWDFVHVPQMTGLFWYCENSLSNDPENAWELAEIKVQHQNIFLSEHYKNRLPDNLPAQQIRAFLERDIESRVAINFAHAGGPHDGQEVSVFTLSMLIDLVTKLIERGQTETAVKYFDLYGCLFEKDRDFPAIAASIDRVRSKPSPSLR